MMIRSQAMFRSSLITVRIGYEHDVVLARQRARQIAAGLGLENQDQVRVATAVSEIARNAFQYGKGGRVEFSIADGTPPRLEIRVADQGPGIEDLQRILDGQYSSATGMGLGILGARRLMDDFAIESIKGQGTTVTMSKQLPVKPGAVTAPTLAHLTVSLSSQVPVGPLGELQAQNQDLLRTLNELEKRQVELAQLNKELEDTNRGVVALYAELDERADYLRRASELKTQFLSNVTHEFRTPLNSILSLTRILLDRLDGDLNSEQEKQVQFIQKAASDLSEIVNDLLDIAKVEAGKLAVRPEEFEVVDLFRALRGMLRPLLAHNQSVALQFDDPVDVPPLHNDQSKVSQILRNLISNALKYTERGEVRVRAALIENGMVAISVSDTGVGIAPADQDRIFEEFVQVEGRHQTGKRGTGLGLPLSRRLAELLGGTLTVQSELGAGSIFTLRVPMAYAARTAESLSPSLSREPDPTRLPVLVVEDNREILLIYEKYLEGTRFQVMPAHTIDQANQLLERCRPVAVVLDILLPHENYWTFLEELKHRPQTGHIPVVVITVLENEHRARAMGADAFHCKPIERAWLIEQLERATGAYVPEELLIIDDDEASRYLLASLLKETRFRVLECANVPDGLRLALERRPVAIFLDLAMPGCDGFAALDLLRSNPETANIPVLVHTGKTLGVQEIQFLENKTVAVLSKTASDRPLVLQRIRQALAKVHA